MAKAPAKKKEYKLDLFGQTLPALYTGDHGFYDRRTEDERKEIHPLVLMRWMSSVKNSELGGDFICLVNNLVNVDFWDLTKHPELQWKLMCVVGSELGGRSQRSEWIAGPKKAATGKVDNVLLSLYPSLNNQELALARGKLTKDSLKQLLRDMGLPDDEIKPILDEFKKSEPNA